MTIHARVPSAHPFRTLDTRMYDIPGSTSKKLFTRPERASLVVSIEYHAGQNQPPRLIRARP